MGPNKRMGTAILMSYFGLSFLIHFGLFCKIFDLLQRKRNYKFLVNKSANNAKTYSCNLLILSSVRLSSVCLSSIPDFALIISDSNLISVWSQIRAYGWEKYQKLINVRRMFIKVHRVTVYTSIITLLIIFLMYLQLRFLTKYET